MMANYKCPECGSGAVNIETTGLVEYSADGVVLERHEEHEDHAYAECRECDHDGIAVDFEHKEG